MGHFQIQFTVMQEDGQRESAILSRSGVDARIVSVITSSRQGHLWLTPLKAVCWSLQQEPARDDKPFAGYYKIICKSLQSRCVQQYRIQLNWREKIIYHSTNGL